MKKKHGKVHGRNFRRYWGEITVGTQEEASKEFPEELWKNSWKSSGAIPAGTLDAFLEKLQISGGTQG